MLDVVVVADTHLRRDWPNRRMPPELLARIDRCDVVLHAGDVCHGGVLEDLAGRARLHTVLGNNDRELVDELPETLVLDLDGVRVAMVHDSGPARGRARRLHDRFPDADVVVFGHSHVPVDEVGVDGQLLFNPGSPTERRRQPLRTYGVLALDAGAVVAREIVPLGP